MKHILLRFFLIFACVAIPLHSHACWDDSSDDYYDYEDDWDWYDDGSIWLDEVIVTSDYDYGNDDEVVYGEIDDSKYDMEDTLNEVVVTPDSNDSNDDDWWRTDYGDDDDYGNDDDWFDYDEDDGVINVGCGEGTQDEDVDPKDRKYLVQSCRLCCVPAVMAIMNMYSKNISIEQAEKLQEQYKDKYKELTGKEVSKSGVTNGDIKSFMTNCGFQLSSCAVGSISECTERGYQVFVFIDAQSDKGEKYGHALDIIHSNIKDGNVVSYDCINPDTGRVETYTADDFKHPEYIYCVRSIKEMQQ